MKKQIITLGLIFLSCTLLKAEIGFGAGAGMLYPGFQSSRQYGSRFGVGFGFDLMARHTLLELDSANVIDARYAYRSYYSDIDLPSNAVTRFTFNYLAIGITWDAFKISDLQLYIGAAAALVTAKAQQRYVNDITESLMLPEILTGAEWELSANYNLFTELGFQFGSLDITSDILPVSGFRLLVGGTMFLTTQE